MKLTQYKGPLLGMVLMALSLATIAQSSTTPSSQTPQSSQTTKKKVYTTPKTTQSAAQSQSNINEAGSSAQVRHDRTGSLDPGHAKTGKTNTAGTGDNNQGQIGQP